MAKVGIIIPPDYAQRLKSGRQTSIQVIIDATDNMSASSALAAAQTLGMLKSQEISENRFRRMGFEIPPQAVNEDTPMVQSEDFITSHGILCQG